MVSRIWSREVWVIGWTMATLTFFPSAAAGADCSAASGVSDVFSAGAAAVPAAPLPPHPVSAAIMTEIAVIAVSMVFFISFPPQLYLFLYLFLPVSLLSSCDPDVLPDDLTGIMQLFLLFF